MKQGEKHNQAVGGFFAGIRVWRTGEVVCRVGRFFFSFHLQLHRMPSFVGSQGICEC